MTILNETYRIYGRRYLLPIVNTVSKFVIHIPLFCFFIYKAGLILTQVPDEVEDCLVGLEGLHLRGEEVELPAVLEPVLGADAPALGQPLIRHPAFHV
jgi:hypothetical protein